MLTWAKLKSHVYGKKYATKAHPAFSTHCYEKPGISYDIVSMERTKIYEFGLKSRYAFFLA